VRRACAGSALRTRQRVIVPVPRRVLTRCGRMCARRGRHGLRAAVLICSVRALPARRGACSTPFCTHSVICHVSFR
jgi:hypothetical protein